ARCVKVEYFSSKMVRNYVCKRERKYTKDDVDRAIKLVQDGVGVHDVAKKTGVPYKTLWRWANKNTSRIGSGRFVSALSTEEEELIVVAIEQCSSMGLPIGFEDVKKMVQTYLDSSEKVTSLKNNIPSKDWLLSFKKRWQHRLVMTWPELLTRATPRNPSFENFNNKQPELSTKTAPKNLSTQNLKKNPKLLTRSSSRNPRAENLNKPPDLLSRRDPGNLSTENLNDKLELLINAISSKLSSQNLNKQSDLLPEQSPSKLSAENLHKKLVTSSLTKRSSRNLSTENLSKTSELRKGSHRNLSRQNLHRKTELLLTRASPQNVPMPNLNQNPEVLTNTSPRKLTPGTLNLNRNPELSTKGSQTKLCTSLENLNKKTETLSKTKATKITTDNIKTFLPLVNKVFKDSSMFEDTIAAERIYNLNETGFVTDPTAKEMFHCKSCRDGRHLSSSQRCEKVVYSVLLAGNAAGEYLPPLVIFKGKKIRQTWREGGPPSCNYACSDSGGMSDKIFENWFCKAFVPSVADKKKPVVVFLDRYAGSPSRTRSCLNQKTLSEAKKRDIHIIHLPPHLNHREDTLQPLDVAVFEQLQDHWRQILLGFYRETRQQEVGNCSFAFLLKLLCEKFSATNLIAGFRRTGLWPYSPDVVRERLKFQVNEPIATMTTTNMSPSASSTSGTKAGSVRKRLQRHSVSNIVTISPTVLSDRNKNSGAGSNPGEVLMTADDDGAVGVNNMSTPSQSPSFSPLTSPSGAVSTRKLLETAIIDTISHSVTDVNKTVGSNSYKRRKIFQPRLSQIVTSATDDNVDTSGKVQSSSSEVLTSFDNIDTTGRVQSKLSQVSMSDSADDVDISNNVQSTTGEILTSANVDNTTERVKYGPGEVLTSAYDVNTESIQSTSCQILTAEVDNTETVECTPDEVLTSADIDTTEIVQCTPGEVLTSDVDTTESVECTPDQILTSADIDTAEIVHCPPGNVLTTDGDMIEIVQTTPGEILTVDNEDMIEIVQSTPGQVLTAAGDHDTIDFNMSSPSVSSSEADSPRKLLHRAIIGSVPPTMTDIGNKYGVTDPPKSRKMVQGTPEGQLLTVHDTLQSVQSAYEEFRERISDVSVSTPSTSRSQAVTVVNKNPTLNSNSRQKRKRVRSTPEEALTSDDNTAERLSQNAARSRRRAKNKKSAAKKSRLENIPTEEEEDLEDNDDGDDDVGDDDVGGGGDDDGGGGDVKCKFCPNWWSTYKGEKHESWLQCDICDDFICPVCMPQGVDTTADFYCRECIDQ
ncbi:hypothetical protein Ahia01_000537800, partial [Argonauta hians]